MSNQESDYLAWEAAQELKGRTVARQGEIKPILDEEDPLPCDIAGNPTGEFEI